MPDSFYADFKVWMITIKWIVSNLAPVVLEEIFSNEAIMVEVKDFALGL